jgi:arginine utilization protein RocB
MEIALRLAKQAMARAAARTGRAIPVLRYEEIAARVAPEAIAAKAGELAQQNHLDLPERSKLLTAHVWQLSGLTGPAVVLGFGSIPYPAVSMADDGLEALVARTIAPFGLTTLGYFPGISDMSFLGLAPGTGDNADTPLAGSSFPMPVPAGYPVINIGPWGRDYHHWLERLHAPYAFETLPAVLLALIAEVLKSD